MKPPAKPRLLANTKTAEPKTSDQYLARLSDDKRAALEKLRQDIRAATPEAEECISYGIPSFRLHGKQFVSYAAAAKHCAFYLGSTVKAFPDELKNYDLAQGTIRFPADKPLPSALVRKLVRRRIAERAPTKK